MKTLRIDEAGHAWFYRAVGNRPITEYRVSAPETVTPASWHRIVMLFFSGKHDDNILNRPGGYKVLVIPDKETTMTSYTEFHARECHTTTRYEAPACMVEVERAHKVAELDAFLAKNSTVEPAPKFARATAPKSAAPRPDYPAYLLRSYGNGLVETL